MEIIFLKKYFFSKQTESQVLTKFKEIVFSHY
jgi:hypothetical protein